jgi:hypothetical protein
LCLRKSAIVLKSGASRPTKPSWRFATTSKIGLKVDRNRQIDPRRAVTRFGRVHSNAGARFPAPRGRFLAAQGAGSSHTCADERPSHSAIKCDGALDTANERDQRVSRSRGDGGATVRGLRRAIYGRWRPRDEPSSATQKPRRLHVSFLGRYEARTRGSPRATI